MNSHIIIEGIGYIGSMIVLVSFLMTSVVKLRVVNTVGSVIFMIYALIIHTYPTAIMNLCLALINIHFLWKMRHTGKEYDLVNVRYDDKYLQYILARRHKDIEACFPGIALTSDQEPGMIGIEVDREPGAAGTGKDSESNLAECSEDPGANVCCYIVTCHLAPAGIVIGRKVGVVYDLVLDYSMPDYRDISLGQFLMYRLKKEGIEKLRYNGPTEHHMDYLNEMGFVLNGGVYEREL